MDIDLRRIQSWERDRVLVVLESIPDGYTRKGGLEMSEDNIAPGCEQSLRKEIEQYLYDRLWQATRIQQTPVPLSDIKHDLRCLKEELGLSGYVKYNELIMDVCELLGARIDPGRPGRGQRSMIVMERRHLIILNGSLHCCSDRELQTFRKDVMM
jgi:hypothetical protein